MKYALSNDARARIVAKDLTKIAKEYGVRLPLTSAQQTTAKLMGYRNWNDLMSEVGRGMGPEDHELSPDGLVVRRSNQKAVLATVGFAPTDLDRVLLILRPTGRTEESILASPKVWPIQTNSDHHPSRLNVALGRLQEDSYYGWNGEYDELHAIMDAWANDRPLSPLDYEACTSAETISLLCSYVSSLAEYTGHLVEVSAVLDHALDGEDLSEGWDVIPDDPADLTRYYFHFGNHRFPSPYKGLGIDGCYVSIFDTSDGETTDPVPDFVSFRFTTSPEFERDCAGVMLSQSPLMELRGLLRTVEIAFSPVDNENLADALTGGDPAGQSDFYLDAWRPYLGVAMAAAWRSLKIYRSRTIKPHDALFVDAHQSHFAKLERANSDSETIERMKEIAQESEDLPVRYLGRTPPSPDVFYEELLASPYPRSDSGPERFVAVDLASKLADIHEIARPSDMLQLGKAILRMCDDLTEGEEKERFRVEAYAALMNGAYMSGAEGAYDAAKSVLLSKSEHKAKFLHGATLVFVRENDLDLALQAVDAMEKTNPSSPMSAAARLLLTALTGDRNEVAQKVASFVKHFKEVAVKIAADQREPWGWDQSDYEDLREMHLHVASVFAGPFLRAGLISPIQSELSIRPTRRR